jgi:hypothetical protein
MSWRGLIVSDGTASTRGVHHAYRTTPLPA